MHKRQDIGTEGLRSPGVISNTSYEYADLWSLVMTIYSLVEGNDFLIFR